MLWQNTYTTNKPTPPAIVNKSIDQYWLITTTTTTTMTTIHPAIIYIIINVRKNNNNDNLIATLSSGFGMRTAL